MTKKEPRVNLTIVADANKNILARQQRFSATEPNRVCHLLTQAR